MKKLNKTSKRNCVDILFADKGGVKLAAPSCSEHLESEIDPLNLFGAPVHDSGIGISEEFLVGEGKEHRQLAAARMVAAAVNDKLLRMPSTDLSLVNSNTPYLLWEGERQVVDNLEFIQRVGKLLARQGSLTSDQFDELWEGWMSSKMRSVPGDGDQAPITGIDRKRLDDAIYAYEVDDDIEVVFGYEDTRQQAAEMVVAMACARRELGLPVIGLWSLGNGVGCDGTHMAIPISSAVMLDLAGYYWEYRDHLSQPGIVVDRQSPDLARAVEIIATARGRFHVGMERVELDALVSNDLAGWLDIVKGFLSPRHDFIQRVARLLVRKGHLSAAQFEFWDRDDSRRQGDGQVSAA